VAVQLMQAKLPVFGHDVVVAAVPMESPFDTPLQPPSAVQVHVHFLGTHWSALPAPAPSIMS
jgi:hypothetical protein